MKRLLFLVFIFCLPTSINCRFEDRIINGEEAPLGKFMFLPKIYFSYSTIGPGGAPRTVSPGECSSTIISKRHILTAAHCVKHLKNPLNDTIPEESMGYPFFVDVRPIEKGIFEGLIKINVTLANFGITSTVYVHEEYVGNAIIPGYDMAIIEFPKGVDFNITPVTLAKNYVDNYDDIAIAAGYGLYQFNVTTQSVSPGSPPTLRYVNVSIRPLIDFFYKDDSKLTASEKAKKVEDDKKLEDEKNRLMCAGNSGELPQRAVHGDSGGPLLFEKNGKIYQIGVGSFINTEIVEAPTVYCRVSYHCEWIEKITNNEAKCQELYVTQPSEITELSPTAEPPKKVNSPEKLNNGAPIFAMNFGYFWIVFCFKFIFATLLL